MDTRTGKIILPEEYEKMKAENSEELKHVKPMEVMPTDKQMKSMKVGRNDLCPCGSGKKFKHCCKAEEEVQKKVDDLIGKIDEL